MIFAAVCGPDAGQRVELLGRRRVEIDRRGRRTDATARRGSAGGAARRNDHLLTVGERRSEIDECRVRLRGDSPRRGQRIGDSRSPRKVHESRPAHLADDVDNELCRGRSMHVRDGTDDRDRRSLRAAVIEQTRHEHDPEHEHDDHGDRPALRDRQSGKLHASTLAADPLRECVGSVPLY